MYFFILIFVAVTFTVLPLLTCISQYKNIALRYNFSSLCLELQNNLYLILSQKFLRQHNNKHIILFFIAAQMHKKTPCKYLFYKKY